MSFLDIIINYKVLLNNGYSKPFLNQSLHTMLSMPFFVLDDWFSSNTDNEYSKKIRQYKIYK